MTAMPGDTRWWPWRDWPLNRVFVTITATVLLFLTLVLALGARQFLLYHQCRQAVVLGDRLLFQFTAITNHLTESLILGEEVNLRSLEDELQQLDQEVAELARNILVPEGLKAQLPSRIDLVGLEVRLRAIQEQRQDQVQERTELVRTLNRLNMGLQQFRFLLGDHTQAILLGLHKIIAGALGMIVVVSCSLLFFINRKLAAPILSLCRLTADDDAEEGATCSLHVLNARIRDLLTRCKGRRLIETVDPADHEQVRHAALLYRCAAAGCIGAELASELTNRLNGVINYIQALIDLEHQEDNRESAAVLFPALVNEAQKTAELVGALQRISQWQPGRDANLSLRTVFRLLALIFVKSLRSEGIALRLPDDCAYETSVSAGDLFLVLCALLQRGRRILKHSPIDPQSERQLRIEWKLYPGDQHRLTLLLSNSADSWEEDIPASIWPSLPFCAHLLQRYDASLTQETTPSSRLVLNLPCRSSVA
jgi:hypothetical protein